MLLHSIRDLLALLQLFPGCYRNIKLGVSLGFLSGIFIACGYASAAFAFSALLLSPVEHYPAATPLWLLAGLLFLLAGFYCRHKAADNNHHVVFRLETELREGLAQRVAQLPLGEVYRLGTGSLKKIIFDDVKSLHAAIADASPFIGVVFGQPLAALLILLLVQWKLFIVVCIMLLAVQSAMMLMMRDFIPQERRYNEAQENTNLAVIEFVQGMPVVRTFDNDQIAYHRFTSRIHEFSAAVIDWMRTTKTASQLSDTLTNTLPSFIAITLASAALLAWQQITFSDMLLALMIGTLPVQAFKPFNIMIHLLFYSRAAARRILSLYQIPCSAEPTISQIPLSSAVQFTDVSFSYNNERQVLSNISFSVPQGSRCALVGASGCGKSTLTRLLARFYDNFSGDIKIGEVSIRDIRSPDLLQKIAFIFQEPFLTADSVAENIRLYRPDATMEQVEQAAQSVNLHNFICSLPEGYNTLVGEKGGRLSGGQRQRITIARAILSQAQIIVLDEATASVDPENEAEITQSLEKLCTGKTVFTIAHRLATIRHCDQIIVLDKGQLMGTGSHQQLLQHCPYYARLWQHYRRAANWTLTATVEKQEPSC